MAMACWGGATMLQTPPFAFESIRPSLAHLNVGPRTRPRLDSCNKECSFYEEFLTLSSNEDPLWHVFYGGFPKNNYNQEDDFRKPQKIKSITSQLNLLTQVRKRILSRFEPLVPKHAQPHFLDHLT